LFFFSAALRLSSPAPFAPPAGLSDGSSLDNSRFSKLARDTGILDSLLTPTAVDLVFSRVKGPGERRIRYREFQRAVEELAKIKVRVGGACSGAGATASPKRTLFDSLFL
jgi:hypothetical protein